MLAESRQRFVDDYLKIRRAEGRGSSDPAYYLALPFQDRSGRLADQWAIRARTWMYFEKHLLPPIENAAPGPLEILDLGAGNCWMSYRLALRGHRPTAVDLVSDSLDGLGASRHFTASLPRAIPCIEADFDRLPFQDERFDLVIFNASVHYSSDYAATLAEARRCLRPEGHIAILDSPVYLKREHGELMRRERHAQFASAYGTESDHIQSIEFFDLEMLRDLSARLGLQWRIHKPWYGWQWHLRPWKARLAGKRPPSRFWILVGDFPRA